MSSNTSLIRHLSHHAESAGKDLKVVLLNAIEELEHLENKVDHFASKSQRFAGALMHIGYGATTTSEMQEIARETLDPQLNREEQEP